MKKVLFAIAALSAVTVASPALAATTVNLGYTDSPSTLYPVAGGGSFTTSVDSGAFSLADLTAFDYAYTVTNGSDVVPFTFKLSDLASLTGTIANGAVSILSFTTQNVNPAPAYSNYFSQNIAVAGLGANQTSVSTVYGYTFASGTTSATVTAGAVPEPATWAMMLAGVGMMGFAMRRSRKSKVNTTVSFA